MPPLETPAKSGIRSRKRFLLPVAVVVLFFVAIVMINLRVESPHGKSGHEQSSGAATVHTLVSSEIQYKSAYGDYTPDLKALGGSADQCQKPTRAHACLVDEVVTNSSAANPKSSYYFTVNAGPSANTFIVWGIPLDSRYRVFCATDDGMVRFSAPGAGVASTSYAACKALPAIPN